MQSVKEVMVGDRPYDVTLALDSTRAFVTNQYDNTLSVINTVTLEQIAVIDVGEYPEGIDTHPDDHHIFVANWFDNTASIIDARTLEVVDTIETGDGTRAYGDMFVIREE